MVAWSEIRSSLLPDSGKALLPPKIKLPVLPLAVTQFSQRAKAPDVEIRELSQIVESDSGLTADLLMYVNSSAIGLRRKASTAQQALTMLGIRNATLHVMTSAVKRAMGRTESKLMNIQNFWMANLERAILAKLVARLLKADEDLAFAAGMLQDLLLPIVTNELYTHYLHFANQQLDNPTHLSDYETRTFRWTHADAAAQIMHAWGFPDDVVCCVALHHRGVQLLADRKLGTTAAAAVAVSAMIPCQLRQVPDGLESLLRLQEAWPAFSLDSLSREVDRLYAETSPGARNPFSFRHLIEKTLLEPAASGA